MLKRWTDAEESFRTALDSAATMAEAHAGLGIALQGLGRLPEAEMALRRAIGLFFDNPLAHLHLGQVLAARGDVAGAANEMRIAKGKRPASPEAQTP